MVLTFLSALRWRALNADRVGFTFLPRTGSPLALSYRELLARASGAAARLTELTKPGDRVLILYPSGLEFLVALFGTLLAKRVAVPARLPLHRRAMERLDGIIRDAGVQTAFGPAVSESLRANFAERGIRLISCDGEPGNPEQEGWEPAPEDLAILQYTSGSTGDPKGVRLTYRNLDANLRFIASTFRHGPGAVIVNWLPLFHDMGLIGNVLHPAASGAHCVFMDPSTFVTHPARWLQAVSEYRATVSGGPNSGYERCLRAIHPERLSSLDLSSWSTAYCGAEPVRARTLQAFAELCRPAGFRANAFLPCYGLAESCLMAAAGEPGRGVTTATAPCTGSGGPFVGCGNNFEHRIAIVGDGGHEVSGGTVGEIWVHSDSIADGYWGKPDDTERVFHGRLAGSAEGPFLRTGDLGFLQNGELFVTGRRKDLLIIAGQNIYPQDVEEISGKAHSALEPGAAAAISSLDDEGEHLVVVQEVRRGAVPDSTALEQAAGRIQAGIVDAYGFAPQAVLLVQSGAVPLTTSGKVRRSECRKLVEAGSLAVLYSLKASGADGLAAHAPLTSETERALAQIWERLLATPIDSAEADFFAAGGVSVLAYQLLAEVHRAFGVSIPARRLFESRTLGAMAAAIDAARHAPGDLAIRDSSEGEILPLLIAQEGLWRLERFAAGSTNRVWMALRINGTADRAALDASLRDLVGRHESLRTVVVEPAAMRIDALPEQPVSWAPRQANPRSTLTETLSGICGGSWDPLRGPLFRAYRIESGLESGLESGPGEPVLALVLHHLITDGWSMRLLLRDLAALYRFHRGITSEFPESPAATLRECVLRQQAWLGSARAEETLAYWRQALDGATTAISLSYARPRPGGSSPQPGQASIDLDPIVTERLARFAAERQATPAMALLAATLTVLYRLSGQDDIVIGVPHANRLDPASLPVVGCFVNLLPVRVAVQGDRSFAVLLDRVKARAEEAWAHQELPFEKIRESVPVRAADRPGATFDAVFDFLDAPDGAGDFSIVSHGSQLAQDFAKFPLTITAAAGRGGWPLSLVYDCGLIPAGMASELLAQLAAIIAQVVEAPNRALDDLSLVTEGARPLLADLSAPLAAHEPVTIPERVAAICRSAPETIAIRRGAEVWTYREVGGDIAAGVEALRSAGIRRGDRVGILGLPAYDTIVAQLAVLTAGAVTLSLDTRLPLERRRLMMEQAGAKLLLAGSAEAEGAKLFAALSGVPLLSLPHGGAPADAAFDPPGGRDGAYVVFTTGTTGIPKAILGCHRGLAHFLDWMRDTFQVGSADCVVNLTNLSFDMALRDVYLPLTSGGTLVLLENPEDVSADRVAPILAESPVTLLHVVPTMARSWLASDLPVTPLPSLRHIFFAGEPLGDNLVRQWRERFPGNYAILNFYGPSETTQTKIFYRVPNPPEPGIQPIGRPLPGAQAVLLNRSGNQCGIGERGEIAIRTPYATLGYMNSPQEQSRRFVRNAASNDPSDLLYRSGDLGRMRPDGCIEILGRIDHQVKIRGIAVDPGEVCGVLLAYPGVKDAAVVVDQQPDGEFALSAYLVADPGVTWAAIHVYLFDRLPSAMAPASHCFLETLPKAANGKLDLRKIKEFAQAPADAPTTSGDGACDSSEVLKIVLEEWRTSLGLPAFGANDDFFLAGGNSLQAIDLAARLRRRGFADLALRDLLQSRTPAAVSRLIEARRGVTPAPAEDRRLVHDESHRYDDFPTTPLQQAYWIGRQSFLELGGAGAYTYREFDAARLDIDRLERALNRVIARHDMLRAVASGENTQRVLPDVPRYTVRRIDLRGAPPDEVQRRLDATRKEMASNVLDLANWPLIDVRVSLFDGGQRLHFGIDAFICDAWSRQILLKEMEGFYSRRDFAPAPLEIAFRDYVVADQAARESEEHRRAVAYWNERAGHLPPPPQLPTLTGVVSPRFQRREGTLPPAAWKEFQQRAAKRQVTPSTALLAAFARILAAWSKSASFTLNLTIFRRTPLHPQVNSLIGDFTAVILHAVDAGLSEPFGAAARRVQAQLWQDLEHASVSGLDVVRRLARTRRELQTSVAPVVFTSALLEGADRQQDGRGFDWAWLGEMTYGISQTPQVWIDHQVYEQGGALHYNWDALEDLFPDPVLDDMLAAYKKLLGDLAGGEDRWDEAARPDIETAEPESAPEVTLHELFDSRALLHPALPAVEQGTRTVSYGELRRLAHELARRLRDTGARRETLIAVCLPKAWEEVVAALAVLYSGAAYLPIDPALPPQRVQHLLEHGEVGIVISAPDVRQEWPAGVAVLEVGQSDTSAGDPIEFISRPADLAYVIYTSGSTGAPKGVTIEHRTAANTILDVNQRLGLKPGDRILALSSLSFDLSVYDIFGALAAGATVVYPQRSEGPDPEHWLDLVRTRGITVWNSVPALMGLLVERAEAMGQDLGSTLRCALLSGDWIPLKLPERIAALACISHKPPADVAQALLPTLRLDTVSARRTGVGMSACATSSHPNTGPAVQVWSLGGATEGSIWSILYPVEEPLAGWSSIPYGAAMARQTVEVLDANLQRRPVWVTGGLFIGGAGLARGYWRNEAETRRRFLTDPVTGRRLYDTGDMGRYRPGGLIEFLGREDSQVKVRGFRVELAEVEFALAKHPQVREAVVLAHGASREHRRLVAYAVLNSPDSVSGAELRRFAGQSLPEYMVPTQFVFLAHMPATANGKVDRRALADPFAVAALAPAEASQPAASASSAGSVDGGRLEKQRALEQAWRQAFGIEQIDPARNFFDLGGDSIIGLRICGNLNRSGFNLSPRELFKRQTIADLIDVLEANRPAARATPGCRNQALAPVQQWFFELGLAHPGHFNQMVKLTPSRPLDLAKLEQALDRCWRSHDLLRSRFVQRDGRWMVESAQESSALQILDASSEEATERLAGAFVLEQGPLVRAAYCAGAAPGGELLIAAHHLVCDAVTWAVIASDIEAAYLSLERGEWGVLPPASSSYHEWIGELQRYAATEMARADAAPWLTGPQAEDARRPLPRDFRGRPETESSAETLAVELDRSTTDLLATRTAEELHARMEDLLLAATFEALHAWVGGAGTLQLDVESHGRVDPSGVLDLSRVSGWFTSLFPVRLGFEQPRGSMDILREVKTRTGGVERRRLAYGALRYLCPDEAVRSRLRGYGRSEVVVNYLGTLESGVSPEGLFRVSRAPAAGWRAPENARPHLLRLTAYRSGGRLHLELGYSRGAHRRSTAERLLHDIEDRIAAFTLSRQSAAQAAVPSDFPLSRLGDEELRALLRQAAAADAAAE